MKTAWAAALILMATVLAAGAHAQSSRAVGAVFQDCQQCPEMVVVPRGNFTMGEEGLPREVPRHAVTIAYDLAVSRYDVTFDEWDACVRDGGCGGYSPSDGGWGRGRRPVINVSWDDAQSYVTWLRQKTGKPYRLVNEAEWEYVARAGGSTIYWWGDNIGVGNANCDGCGSQWDNKQTSPVGSFKPNAFGVYDTAGNVTQWVQDTWNATFNGAPTNGSAWETGDPRRKVMRSGSWFNKPSLQHSGYRNGDAPYTRNVKIGFRIALTLHP